MATARKVSLFERELTVRLSPAALDVLFDQPRVLSEGQVDPDHFVGSTMLTIDLARTADRVSDPADAATARRVADLMTDDERTRARARRIALTEAARSAGDLDTPEVDLRVRAAGALLHLDLDVEARRKS